MDLYSYEDAHCPKGPGGNMCLVNQDEQMILDRTTQNLSMRAEGYQESEAH